MNVNVYAVGVIISVVNPAGTYNVARNSGFTSTPDVSCRTPIDRVVVVTAVACILISIMLS